MMSEAISRPAVSQTIYPAPAAAGAQAARPGVGKWRLPSWISPRVMAGLWIALVAYGTLVPFNFQIEQSWQPSQSVVGWFIGVVTSPQWFSFEHGDVSSLGTPQWVNDLLTNVLLYAPLGFFLRLDAWRRQWRWWSQMALVVGVIFTLSWALECTQGLMKGRIGSLNDICTNTAGGVAGALFAVGLAQVSRKVVFWLYCRASYVLYHTKEFLIRQRRKPVFMFVVVGVNILLVAYGYVGATAAQQGGESEVVNWLPFMQQFKRSYDVAALQIGRSLVVYCLFAMILSLQFMRASHRKSLWWVVILVAVLAVVREVIQFQTAGMRADITEPIIGLMAVGFIITTACLLIHAVRCSCRRKTQVHVENDRRRIPHNYDG